MRYSILYVVSALYMPPIYLHRKPFAFSDIPTASLRTHRDQAEFLPPGMINKDTALRIKTEWEQNYSGANQGKVVAWVWPNGKH
jgi:hypothetical protein